MQTKICPFCDQSMPVINVVCHDCGREQPSPDRPAGAAYWQELLVALDDFEISQDELDRLQMVRKAEGLTEGQIRAYHAAAAVWILGSTGRDGVIDDDERNRVAFVWASLGALGWAPGQ